MEKFTIGNSIFDFPIPKYVIISNKRSIRIVCGNIKRKTKLDLSFSYFVPYMNSKGTFALVHKSDIRNFINKFNGCDIQEFDNALDESQYEKIWFRPFEATPEKNLFIFQRQSSVQNNSDIKTYEQYLSSAVDYTNSSMFLLSSYIHCDQTFPRQRISKEDVKMIQTCYKSSSFSRNINHSIGLNIY